MAAPPTSRPKLDVTVTKPTPYTFDLGLLLASDPNPLPSSTTSPTTTPSTEAVLASTAREGAQALINQLLTTLPLSATPSGVLLTLPAPTTPLPREKPVPEPKAPSKWAQFAARKGIKPKTREARRAKGSQYNEETGAWERTWGHDRAGKAGARRRHEEEGVVQRDWLVEVDEKAEREGKKEKSKRRRKA
ncbi:ribosomal biogenesis regulatory protein [Whalleya microplaca]|nr:ribosomal biogenesis regulatory protein [Whalleya microplaca]